MAHPTDDELEALAQRLELVGPTDVEAVDMLRACKTGDAPDHETWNAAIEVAAKVAPSQRKPQAMTDQDTSPQAVERLAARLRTSQQPSIGQRRSIAAMLSALSAERDALKAELAEAKLLLSHMVNHAEWREKNEGVFWEASEQARAFLARHQKGTDT